VTEAISHWINLGDNQLGDTFRSTGQHESGQM